MNYGQIRLRLTKAVPGVDLELIDGWMQDRYAQILDELPWKRLEGESVFQVPPSYAAGTVAAIQGNSAIVGTGTTWTTAMTGRAIKINNGNEFYQFTCTDATHGTLDRPFEQATGAIVTAAVGAAGTGYVSGDLFNITGGGDGAAQGQVIAVGAGGSVQSFQLLSNGSTYAVASGLTTTIGSGSGLTINVTAVGASSGFSYRIDQNVFLLPASCRILRGIRCVNLGWKLDGDHFISAAEMKRMFRRLPTYGTPQYAACTWDAFTDPPLQQVELCPIPVSPDSNGQTPGFAVDYIYDPAAIDATATSTTLLPWVRPAALIEGVTADMKLHLDNFNSANAHEAKFLNLLNQMKRVNGAQRGPQPLRTSPELRRQTAPHYSHGPKHPGYTG
jgi:hypothetical protein